MGLFSRTKPTRLSIESGDTDPKIEITTHKKATKEQVEAVRVAQDNLNKVLEENGFTIKILVAMGGKHPGKLSKQ